MRRIVIGILIGLSLVGIYFALLWQKRAHEVTNQGRYKLRRRYIKVKPER